MINLRLAGGLGNQLFQLAAAIYLSRVKLYGSVCLFPSSTSKYSTPRSPDIFGILKFKASNLFSDNESILYDAAITKTRIGKFLPIVGISDRNIRTYFDSSPIIKFLIMDGYFQDHWLSSEFNFVSKYILNYLLVNESIKIYSNKFDCVIHIRGGDFTLIPSFGFISFEWYVNKINQLSKIVNLKRILILSDDILLKNQLLRELKYKYPNIDIQIGYDFSVIEDFLILNSAKSRIIGNSTFGLFAAALDVNESPTILHNYFTIDRKRAWSLSCEI